MQDRTASHMHTETMRLLRQYGIRVLDWPSHSVDLNLIEAIWKSIKKSIAKKHGR